MSFDRYRITYHLTQDGWVSAEDARPAQKVIETWEKEVYQGSGFGPESEKWLRLSINTNYTERERSDLRNRFPVPARPPISGEILEGIVLNGLANKKPRGG